MQDCYTAVADPEPVETHPYRDAAIALGLVLMFVMIFDIWQLSHHGKTISHLIQHWTGGKFWRIALVLISALVLGWHLAIGFGRFDR